MGTSNFAPKINTSHIYAVLMNREETFKRCDDCGTKHYEWEYDLDTLTKCVDCESVNLTEETESVPPESWDKDDLIDQIQDRITAEGGTTYNYSNKDNESFGQLDKWERFEGVDIEICAVAIIQYGYYEGATLDFLMSATVDTDEFNLSTGSSYDVEFKDVAEAVINSIEWFAEDESLFDEDGVLLADERKRLETEIMDWIEQSYSELVQKMDKILSDFAEYKLGVSARFSNGETWYSTIK